MKHLLSVEKSANGDNPTTLGERANRQPRESTSRVRPNRYDDSYGIHDEAAAALP
jgi:hypothetical protein